MAQLTKFLEKPALNELEKQGMIKSFEYTYELAWKTLKDYLVEIGFHEIIGPKAAIRTAFTEGILEDGDVWMSMVESRNLTSHTYNEVYADDIVERITNTFFSHFEKLKDRLDEE